MLRSKLPRNASGGAPVRTEAEAGVSHLGTFLLLLAVMFDVSLCRLLSVVAGMKVVSVCDMGMMRRLLVRTRLMVLCGFLVMVSRVLEVFGRLHVMFRRLLRHIVLLVYECHCNATPCTSRRGFVQPRVCEANGSDCH